MPAWTRNPPAENSVSIQKARVAIAWRTVKLVSLTGGVVSWRSPSSPCMAAPVGRGAGSGSNPMSSGRRAISSRDGITPTMQVITPRQTQAVRQSHPVIMDWATSGRIPRPAPLATASIANPRGRRRMNQLLIDVGRPNSSGPANIMRPGTYRA